jgi:hypothetical protein
VFGNEEPQQGQEQEGGARSAGLIVVVHHQLYPAWKT